MLSNIKKYSIVAIAFFIVGSISTIIVSNLLLPKKDKGSIITAQTVSGDPLNIKNISYSNKDKTTTINTSYSGAGTSNIIIPNASNPSANAWDNYHWGLGAMVSTNKTFYLIGSYRYERIMGLGSVWYKNQNGYEFGVTVGAMYIFNL